MKDLVEDARANFGTAPREADGPTATYGFSGAESCSLTLSLSGEKAFHCIWHHDYRSEGAAATFENLNDALLGCFGDQAQLTEDQPVNHPDFYDLRQYELDRIRMTVSLKDKSAEQRTYVVFRVHGTK